MTTPEPRLLSIPDAATYLGGIDTDMIHKLAKEGNLTKVKIGRRSFITRESADALVDSRIETETAE